MPTSTPLRAALLAAVAACGPDAPATPSPTRHPLVGTYDVAAALTTYRPDVRRPDTVAADASVTGTIVVADTVEPRGAQTFFPDVCLTTVFCAARGSCAPAESHATFTTLFDPPSLTIGFADGPIIFHLDGPFAGDSIAGAAYYQSGTARYDGRFVARRRR